jgi:hypothetical protein
MLSEALKTAKTDANTILALAKAYVTMVTANKLALFKTPDVWKIAKKEMLK